MSAHQTNEEVKKHGDALNKALQEADEHNQDKGSAVPPADNGGHPRSAAAHLNDSEHLHGNGLQGGHQHQPMGLVNALREPPQEVTRTGKDHKGQ